MCAQEAPDVAAWQDGVFTVAQAVEAGWSPRQVRRRREAGQWVTVAGRGLAVALVPGHSFTPQALARAAQLTWPDAVACRRTAAGVHGLPVRSGPVAEVLTAVPRRPIAGLRPHRETRHPTCSPVTVSGLRVTGRQRTALDCLAFLPFDEALDLYAWLSSRREVRREDLAADLQGRLGRPGARQLARLLTATRSGAVSVAEHRLHALLRRARITGWQAGAEITHRGRVLGVVDVLFERQHVVIEVDGEAAHSGRTAFVADRRRQNALIGAGYLVLRVTWWDIVERPQAVIADIRRTLALRSR
jgi:very-short-patch-repair endonuclease